MDQEIKFDGKNSPFKFLEPYMEGEHRYFFGREKEEAELYEYIRKTKVLLLYGISGAGKTSLLQCGLSNKFRLSGGWIPIFIRRGENINESLRRELQSKMKEIFAYHSEEINDDDWEADEINSDEELMESIKLLYGYTLKPVFLVFDQFEEFVMMKDHKKTDTERKQFVDTLRMLFEARNKPYFNIIILMREEFFGPFDTIMKSIPGIADWRMRLNPMKEKRVIHVIKELLAIGNITLQNPDEDAKKIYNSLKNYKGEVSLSNLQIYLDQFWWKDYKTDYANKPHPAGGAFPPLTFLTKEIEEFGSIDVVLQRFLVQQKGEIGNKIKDKFPNLDPVFLDHTLAEFINEDGGKKPVSYIIDGNYYKFTGVDIGKLDEMNREFLKFTIDLLGKYRILRIGRNSIELSHDSLAKLIFDQREARYKKQIRIRQRMKAIEEGSEKASPDEVNGWTEYIDKNFFTNVELKQYMVLKENARDELIKKKAKQNRLTVFITMFVLGTVLMAFLIYHQVRSMKDRQDFYAIQYMAKLDTFTNGIHALTLAKYLYDGINDTANGKVIKDKMLQIAASENLQRQYSLYQLDNPSKLSRVAGTSATISNKGSYLIQMLSDTSESEFDYKDFVIITQNGQQLDTMKDAQAYIVNENEILIHKLKEKTIGLYAITDLKTPKTKINWENTAKRWIDFYSQRPKLLKSGKLVIPYTTSGDPSLLSSFNRIRISGYTLLDFKNQKESQFPLMVDIPAEFTCTSISASSALVVCISSESKTQNQWLLIYYTDSTGKLLRKVKTGDRNIYNRIYRVTESGKIGFYSYYGSRDSLYVSNDSGRSFNKFKINSNFYGIDLDNNRFVTKKSDSVIQLLDFSGKIIDSFKTPGRIQYPPRYDAGNNRTMFQVGSDASAERFLYILDQYLKPIAAYTIPQGAIYNWSDSGDAIVFSNNKSIIAYRIPGFFLSFMNFQSLNEWMETIIKTDREAHEDTLRFLKHRYRIKEPGLFS